MRWLPASELVLSVLGTLAAAFLCLRLIRFRLHTKYRFLTAYLCWTVINVPVALTIGFVHPHWYKLTYMYFEGVSIVLLLLVVLEVFTLVLRGLTGIARVTGVYIRVAVVVCSLGAAALLLIDNRPVNRWQMFQFFKQAVDSSALFFVLLLTIFLLWYPVRVSRNTTTYAVGFCVYFSCETAFLLILNTVHRQERVVSPVLMMASAACLIYWGLRVKPEGEIIALADLSWRPEDERRVLGQIRTINSELSDQSPRE